MRLLPLKCYISRALHVPKRQGRGICRVVGAAWRVLGTAEEEKRMYCVSAAHDAA